MGRQIRSSQEIRSTLISNLEGAINYVVEQIWKENRSLIETVIYNSYSPNVYTRTGEFKGAWETETKTMGDKIQGAFKYAPDKMSTGMGTHGSIYGDDDFRQYLAEAIYQGLSGDFGYGENTGRKRYAKTNPLFSGEPWAEKRDVWAILNKEIGARKIKKYFEEGMKANGLEYRGHTAAVKVTKYEEK